MTVPEIRCLADPPGLSAADVVEETCAVMDVMCENSGICRGHPDTQSHPTHSSFRSAADTWPIDHTHHCHRPATATPQFHVQDVCSITEKGEAVATQPRVGALGRRIVIGARGRIT